MRRIVKNRKSRLAVFKLLLVYESTARHSDPQPSSKNLWSEGESDEKGHDRHQSQNKSKGRSFHESDTKSRTKTSRFESVC